MQAATTQTADAGLNPTEAHDESESAPLTDRGDAPGLFGDRDDQALRVYTSDAVVWFTPLETERTGTVHTYRQEVPERTDVSETPLRDAHATIDRHGCECVRLESTPAWALLAARENAGGGSAP